MIYTCHTYTPKYPRGTRIHQIIHVFISINIIYHNNNNVVSVIISKPLSGVPRIVVKPKLTSAILISRNPTLPTTPQNALPTSLAGLALRPKPDRVHPHPPFRHRPRQLALPLALLRILFLRLCARRRRRVRRPPSRPIFPLRCPARHAHRPLRNSRPAQPARHALPALRPARLLPHLPRRLLALAPDDCRPVRGRFLA